MALFSAKIRPITTLFGSFQCLPTHSRFRRFFLMSSAQIQDSNVEIQFSGFKILCGKHCGMHLTKYFQRYFCGYVGGFVVAVVLCCLFVLCGKPVTLLVSANQNRADISKMAVSLSDAGKYACNEMLEQGQSSRELHPSPSSSPIL